MAKEKAAPGRDGGKQDGIRTGSVEGGNDVVQGVGPGAKRQAHSPAVGVVGARKTLVKPETVVGDHVVDGETVLFHDCASLSGSQSGGWW